ncbi:MAG: biotin--[acetyl-CoA-carboxylase] ligase [Victivallales bacterium]|nr:biotin--[acetyl-CoA-carboxylase] ligase [Victivallales bacterium]
MRIEHFDKIDSTNLLALREFARFADGTLVTAGEQTGGMGRRGRSWLSPPGVNLYATYIVKRPLFPVGDAMLIGGLAALDALREFAPRAELWLKWPNDICCGPPPGTARPESDTVNNGAVNTEYRKNENQSPRKSIESNRSGNACEASSPQVGGIVSDGRDSRGFRKIAGLLAQTHSPEASNDVDGVVLGIGVNLNMNPEQLSRIGRPAASVLSETGKAVDPATFAEFLLERLGFYKKMAESAPESLFEKWVAANSLIGGNIEIALENGDSFSGKVVGIRRDGAIILQTESGAESAFVAGDALPASR